MKTRVETRVSWTSALFCLLFAFGAFANDELVLAPPGEAPWKPLHFPKIATHTQFEPAAEAGSGEESGGGKSWWKKIFD